MRKQLRKRIKNRKQERSAKYGRPKNTSRATATALVAAGTLSSTPSSSLPARIRRSPVLSRYVDSHNVLVVGDGDFTFGRALVKLRSKYQAQKVDDNKDGEDDSEEAISGSLTVTGYDSRSEALKKYANNGSNDKNKGIEESLNIIAKQRDSYVLHSIDATKLNQQLGPGSKISKQNHPEESHNYDVVVFNFPHSGQQRVHINRNLMHDFFQSVRELFLAQTKHRQQQNVVRQVHVTIKNQRPYIDWNIEASAKEAGFGFGLSKKKQKVSFDMNLWNSLGYRHQTTLGPQQATSQPHLLAKGEGSEARLAQTWIFEFEQDRSTSFTAAANLGDRISKAKSQDDIKQKTSPPSPPQKQTNEQQQPSSIDSCSIDSTTNQKQANQEDEQEKDKDANEVNHISQELINDLVQKRDQARHDKNWPEADRIRILLQTEHSILLCDQKDGKTTWLVPKHNKNKNENLVMSGKKKRQRKHLKEKE